jgi:RHS repeat-associated protein
MRNYLLDGLYVICEFSDSGDVLREYVPGVCFVSGGGVYYYHYDRLGSVRFISDSSGNVVQEYVYDVWGNVVSSSGSVSQPYEFVGREGYYREGELYLLGQRWYDSSVGRFISRDPILNSKINLFLKFPFSRLNIINLYGYVYNNPLGITDSHGLSEQKPGCDIVGWIPFPPPSWNENRCTRSCCDRHDECYSENGCSWHTWAYILTPKCENSCDKCNREVVGCLVGCFLQPSFWDNYYGGRPYIYILPPWVDNSSFFIGSII